MLISRLIILFVLSLVRSIRSDGQFLNITTTTMLVRFQDVSDNIKMVNELKGRCHHYCGFFSDKLLSPIQSDATVRIGDIEYKVEGTVLDHAFDGEDSIITEKRIVKVENQDDDNGAHLYDGAVVRNSLDQIVGLLTVRGDYRLVQDAFKLFNVHLSRTKVTVQEKTKMIAYADRQFDTKLELVEYIASKDHKTGHDGCVIYHRKGGADAQIVTYRNGLQNLNIHTRQTLAIP